MIGEKRKKDDKERGVTVRAARAAEATVRHMRNTWIYVLCRFMVIAAAAFFLTDVHIGYALSPFSVSLTAALPPFGAAASFIGMSIAAAASDNSMACLAELAAGGIMLVFRLIFGKNVSAVKAAAASGIAYILAAAAVSAGAGSTPDILLVFALLVRAVLCTGGTLFFANAAEMLLEKTGFSGEKSRLKICSVGAVYIIIIAALCARTLGMLCLGRIAAGFCTAVAARKYGTRGGSIAGIASGAAFVLADSGYSRCAAMLAVGGLVSGLYYRKGKHSVNVAFICACFGIAAAAGLPSGAAEFIADMGIASVIYCFVPERAYMPFLNGFFKGNMHELHCGSDRLAFSAAIMEDIGNDIRSASGLLAAHRRKNDPAETLKSRICGGICQKQNCAVHRGGASFMGFRNGFAAAAAAAEKKGYISARELPPCFDCCTQKSLLLSGITEYARISVLERRSAESGRRFLEAFGEQLSASCGLMRSISSIPQSGMSIDAGLSETASEQLRYMLSAEVSVTVMLDEESRPYIEAYSDILPELSPSRLLEMTERLSEVIGDSLELPVITSVSEDGPHRMRWCAEAQYSVECSIIGYSAEEGTSGDSSASFEDGRGFSYIILSDGMGRGSRAAAQSCTAVSVLKRLILSGADMKSTLKYLGVILGASSPDEIFTTVDILKINCMDGSAQLIKLGAAPTYIRTANSEGAVQTHICEICSAPAGILPAADLSEGLPCESFPLDDASRVVMTTDGIGQECSAYIFELMENERLTPVQIAEKILAYSDECENSDSERMRLRDDKTAAVIRLYKNRHSLPVRSAVP